VNRVVILGRGGSGKSVLANRLATMTGIPAVELDTLFWRRGLQPTAPDEWVALQEDLTRSSRWILDGDLGPYDVVDPRLMRADTVVILDFSLFRSGWRSLRRSRERSDYWSWLFWWRWKSRRSLLRAIADRASNAQLYVLRTPRDVERFLTQVSHQ
jgi:adenylate kinase family enzyme